MNGDGSQTTPWQIVNYSDLKKFGRGFDAEDNLTYALNHHYELVSNIDASPSLTDNGIYGWIPLQNFVGAFNGNHFAIDSLYHYFVNNTFTSHYSGFFGYINASALLVIRNLKLTNVDMTMQTTAGNKNLGALIGSCSIGSTGFSSTIENITVTGRVQCSVGPNNNCGGLIGGLSGNFTIKNIKSSVNVVVVGGNYQISVGGIIASIGTFLTASIMTDCYFDGTFDIPQNLVLVGGIIGTLHGTAATNQIGNFHRCYNVADMSALLDDSHQRPLIANWIDFATTRLITSNLFFDTEATGKSTCPYVGISHTSAEMRAILTYSGWDIVPHTEHDHEEATAIWYINEGIDYPRLWFEGLQIPQIVITLTGLKDHTEIRVMLHGTQTEIAGIEEAVNGTTDNRSFSFSTDVAQYIDIVLFSLPWISFSILNYLVPLHEVSMPVFQYVDRVYLNP